MPVSGNIGDTIQFQVTDATSVTGVKFGSGQANFNKISETVLDTIVPQTATYGKVVFEKNNSVETFDITAIGDGNDGAYSALTGVINTSGFFDTALSGCTTGDVTFTDHNTASGVCIITATGSSLAQASGIVVSGHASGYCGGPTGFSTGDYTISETRLGDVTASALGGSDNFVAFATVEYTGNLNVKQAAVTVTCNESGIQTETTDNFVTLSRINSFSAVPSGGGTIDIFGNVLSSITGVNLGTGLSLSFSGDNTTLNAVVPTGEYNDFLYFDLYSGLSVVSNTKYITSGEVSGSDKSQQLFIFPNQRITDTKGSTSNAIVNGSGLSDLTSVIYRSRDSVQVTPTGFNSTSGQLTVSISGLATGFHDIIITKSGASVTGVDFVQILDNVSHSYGYETYISSGFRYLQELTSGSDLAAALGAETYEFLNTGEADRISLAFSGGAINAGNVTFSLSKKSDVTQTVTTEYTIKGFGQSESLADTEAYNKFNSGTYTQGLYGAYDPNVSYNLDPRICSITSETTSETTVDSTFTSTGTYTGIISGSPLALPLITQLRNDNVGKYNSYNSSQNLFCTIISETGVTSGVIGVTDTGVAVTVSASGYNASDNLASINAMMDGTGAYSGYNLISTSTGISDNFESYSYSSGISFPFDSVQLENTNDQIWHNVHSSGMSILYPAGWGGEHSLSSGFAVITGSATGSTTLTFSGQSVSAVNTLITQEIQNNRKYCTTGDPSYFTTGEIVNLTETGYFYGYC